MKAKPKYTMADLCNICDAGAKVTFLLRNDYEGPDGIVSDLYEDGVIVDVYRIQYASDDLGPPCADIQADDGNLYEELRPDEIECPWYDKVRDKKLTKLLRRANLDRE